MGIFTDPMNLFQDLPVPQTIGSVLIPDQKTRRPWKTRVMSASMFLGTVWTLFALLGAASAFWQAIKNLSRTNLQREDNAILLAIAYFLLMFLPIPFVHAGALFGYWTPRLILPALLCFFMAGFILIDRKLAEKSNKIVLGVLLLVAIQCGTEIAILI
jgi:hypothetical protein